MHTDDHLLHRRDLGFRLSPGNLSGELWGIASYFNPAGYLNKLEHLKLFSGSARTQGLRLLIVELAFDGAPFVLPEKIADRIVRVRSNAVLWQKERLLNIALQELPPSCDKVAWLDADILFENNSWVSETSRLLKEYVVVQPYDVAHWLPPEWKTRPPDSNEPIMPGVACAHFLNPVKSQIQGHPGFAWAARRTLLNAHGFYDRFILGGADLVISSAMYGYSESPTGRKLLRDICSPAQAEDVSGWTQRFYGDVRGRVSFVDGAVLHLWHGDTKHRQYGYRNLILKDADFDPHADIEIDSNRCWSWSSKKFELHERVREYFSSRREEG